MEKDRDAKWGGLLRRYSARRIAVMLAAVVFMGVGVGLFVRGAMGADPYSTLNLGVSSKLGMAFGTWQAILNIVLLLVIVFADRSMLGLGTIGNMFLVGFSADLFGAVFGPLFPAEPGIPLRLFLTLLGVICQIVGCSFYVTADLGMAPYDCISYLIPNRTRIPFRVWRIFLDVVCVAVGFACGAAVGIGTIVMAFGTGPLLPFLNEHVAKPILYPKKRGRG